MPKNNKIIQNLKENIVNYIVIIVVLAGLIWGGVFLKNKYAKQEPKSVYSVAVVVRNNGDLQYGDILLYKEGADRPWSKSERDTYLILKMELSSEEAQKLTERVEREMTNEEKDQELERFKQDRENISEEELKNFREDLENRRIEVASRKYRIDMENEFKNFNVKQLYTGQPYSDQMFTWKIVEKKK